MSKYLARLAILMFAAIVIPACGGTKTKFIVIPPAASATVPGTHATIQAAINATNTGIIQIGPGTYIENLVLHDGIELRGDVFGTKVNGKITAASGTNIKVYGLQILGAATASDINADVFFEACTIKGTMRVDNTAHPFFQHCTFDGGASANGLSAIQVISGFVKVQHSVLENWGTALNTTIAGGTFAGNFNWCLFYQNGTNVAGSWVGTVTTGNPMHTNLIDGQYFLDEGSPGIMAGDPAGAWGSIDWVVRPSLTSTNLAGSLTGGDQKVLEVIINAIGAAGSTLAITELHLTIATNHPANPSSSYAVHVEEVGPSGTNQRANGTMQILNDDVVIPLTNASIPAGQSRTYQLFLDVSPLNVAGDTILVTLKALRWTDDGLLFCTNGNPADGFPLNSGTLTR